MNRIKLTDAGSEVVRLVERVNVVTTGKWPDYELVSGDDCVVIPKTAADRQLGRLNLTDVNQLVGSWVKVSRSDTPGDNGKLFWNLTVVPAPSVPSKRLPPPSAKPQPFDLPTPDEVAHIADPYAGNSHPVRQAGMPDLSAVPLPPEPDWVREEPTPTRTVAPNAVKRAAILDDYCALLHHIRKHSGLTEDLAIQSAAATVQIQWDKKGLA